jgi:hypothetical protein
MRALEGVGVRAGATGAASAAGAAQVCADRDARERLRLRADATVLLLVTEGVTDPAHHSRVTGRA